MGKIIIPASRPKITIEEVLGMVSKLTNEEAKNSPLKLVGLRGYYPRSVGSIPYGNEVGVYDDGLAVVFTPKSGKVRYATFNFNTDPERYRLGVASLDTGVWWFKKHWHKGKYPALGQSRTVTIHRSGKTAHFTGFFGINIHYGGTATTWSLGCQTVPKPQWPEFKNLVYSCMDTAHLIEVPYYLFDV